MCDFSQPQVPFTSGTPVEFETWLSWVDPNYDDFVEKSKFSGIVTDFGIVGCSGCAYCYYITIIEPEAYRGIETKIFWGDVKKIEVT